MKYFDILPDGVEEELTKRGVDTSSLLYCVKADMDYEGCYYDVYLTFDLNDLYILSGCETISLGNTKRRSSAKTEVTFEFHDYREIHLNEIKNMYLDRASSTARLMIERQDGGPHECLARFSLGFAGKFENFSERVNKKNLGEEIDDSLLDGVKTHCPVCKQPFPDPNRPICPWCVDRRSIFWRLLGMFKDFKFAVFSILITIMLSGVFTIISPYFGTKLLYDEVLVIGGEYYGKVLMVVILIAATSLISTLLRMASGVITAIVTPKVTHKLRCEIFEAMQKLSLSFFTNKQTGSLMTRVDRDSDNLYWFFTDIIPYGLSNLAKIAGVVSIMIYLSPLLSIGIIGIAAIINISQRKFAKSQRKLYRKLHIAQRSTTAVLSDAMNGQRVVKAFAKEKEEVKRYDRKNDDMYRVDMQINNRIANVMPVIQYSTRVINTILYGVGAWLIVIGKLELGALTALISYTDMLNEPIRFFTWIGDRWARCADAASRMFEILEAKPTVKEAENPVRMEHLKGDISVKNISFAYEPGYPIIEKASFDIKAGQMFGIVGKTGAGKSTIINLMARLYDVTDGEITVDGVGIKDIATEDLRRNIGIVSQETYIFMGSVADNIRYAKPQASMEEVIEAAKSANAHEFIVKLPNGYDTEIGAGRANLSGGERQRISIARAIIQKPDILILDEATASMDTRTERKIQNAIDSLKKGRTIISIAHRLSTLRDADMLCVIDRGKVAEIGTHELLIHKKGKYFDLYKLQSDALKFIGE